MSGSTLTLTGVEVAGATIVVAGHRHPGRFPGLACRPASRSGLTVKNRAPVCNFTDQTVNVGVAKDLGVTASFSQPDGLGMTCTWTRSLDISIATVEKLDSNTTLRITGKSVENTTVEVTVADEHGASTPTESFAVTVDDPPPPPPTCGLNVDWQPRDHRD